MGLIFNGHDFEDELRVNPARRIMPGTSVDSVSIPGGDKAVLTKSELEPVMFQVKARLKGDPSDGLMPAMRELAPLLHTREPKPLYLPDEPDKYYLAVLQGDTALDKPLNGSSTTLEFYCPDPIAYGAERTEKVPATVETGGTWKSWPTVRAVPESGVSAWRVTASNGQYVEVIADFDGVTELVIDMGAEEATFGGEVAEVSMYSDFFAIEGEETVSATSEATMTWTERWL